MMKNNDLEILAAFYRTTVCRHYSHAQRQKLLHLWAVIGGMELGTNMYRHLVKLNERVDSFGIERQEDVKFILWLLSGEDEHLISAIKALQRSYEYAHSKGYHVSYKTPISWRNAVFNGDDYDDDSRIERGLILYAEGYYDKALTAWSSTDHVEARQCLAALYEIMEDPENALIQLTVVDRIFQEKLLLSSFPFKAGMSATRERLLAKIDAQMIDEIKQKANLDFQHAHTKSRDRVIGFA